MSDESPSPSFQEAEHEKFRALSDKWWDPAGPFKPLHELHAARLPIILDMIRRHWPAGAAAAPDEEFKHLRILDAGCGGGLMAEALAARGAQVTGIDPVAENIAVAEAHAAAQGLTIGYGVETVENLVASGALYDVVLALEVLEHAADQKGFVTALARLVKPGGLLIIATLNRTLRSFLFAIVGAEYILRKLPRGTHAWERFRRPGEIHPLLTAEGLITERIMGLSYNPLRQPRWRASSDPTVNYIIRASRPKAAEPGVLYLPGSDTP